MIALFLLAALTGTGTEAQPIDRPWSVLDAGVAQTSADDRAKAIHALALLRGNKRAERIAVQALQDKSTDVRAEAATSLGAMNARSAIPQLRKALEDEQVKVVLSAAHALYVMNDPSAYEIYYAVLTGQRKGTPSLIESELAILKNRRQLEKLAFQTGIGFVPFGSMGYEAWKTITSSDSSVVRADAAERLARDPDPRSAGALQRACSSSKSEIRLAAADALAKRGDPALSGSLVPLLYDNSREVRYEAAAALIYLSYAPKVTRHSRRTQTAPAHGSSESK
ncbi:MAG: HEAT repeat domain-containing protein [Acidobacteriaceae bacterium]|nr:HEAT repeat domain-containing protein [Acidobacteriaceae bacterium]MBV9503088.1 HEAT repeat domain-containing protein [Acidobacteriaceae bacterium]